MSLVLGTLFLLVCASGKQILRAFDQTSCKGQGHVRKGRYFGLGVWVLLYHIQRQMSGVANINFFRDRRGIILKLVVLFCNVPAHGCGVGPSYSFALNHSFSSASWALVWVHSSQRRMLWCLKKISNNSMKKLMSFRGLYLVMVYERTCNTIDLVGISPYVTIYIVAL